MSEVIIDGIRYVPAEKQADRISLHYMHDGHVFSKIKGNSIDELIAHATAIALSEDGEYGMLCSPIIMSGKKEVRRINANAHARKRTDEKHWSEQVSQWRNIVEADAEFVSLLNKGANK